MSLPVPSGQTHLTHPKYRADIDGLRAIAVLAVVGFHAFPFWVQGGFIGVDVFFVISGFLISSIIMSSLEKNAFSFAEFYARRIKRIFPALILVMAACFAFGWFVMLPDEYKQLGKHMSAGAGFVSNLIYWQEVGYFDNAAQTKPLLHLWSLGIEEQFYIAWPILLYLAWKWRLNFLILVVLIVVVAFSVNVSIRHTDPARDFYSPLIRSWELMLGSILAYLNLKKINLLDKAIQTFGPAMSKAGIEFRPSEISWNNALSFFGVLLIILGALFINKEAAFPGLWALLPTTGTFSIIAAGQHAWLNRMVLSHRILVWFGVISYPLYLWHWPLLSFAHILEYGMPSQEIRTVCAICSIALAWLTYRYIEKPFRYGGHSKIKTASLLVLMIIVGSVGYYSFANGGLRFRLNKEAKEAQEYYDYFDISLPEQKYFERIDASKKYRDECDFYDLEKYRLGKHTLIPRNEISRTCFERDALYSHAIFLWGDSHAQQLYVGLNNYLPKSWQILQVTSSACNPDPTVTDPSTIDYCTQSNYFALNTIEDTKPDVVIVAQNAGQNIQSFQAIAEKLKHLGIKKILFIGPTPHWTARLPKIIATNLWINTPRRTYVDIDQDILSNNRTLQRGFKQTNSELFVNLIDLFCNKDGCLTYIGNDKKIGVTSFDEGHLTPIASDYAAKYLLVDLIINNDSEARK